MGSGENSGLNSILQNAVEATYRALPENYRSLKSATHEFTILDAADGKKMLQYPLLHLSEHNQQRALETLKYVFSHPDFRIQVVREGNPALPFVQISHASGQMPIAGHDIIQCIRDGRTINQVWLQKGGAALAKSTEAAVPMLSRFMEVDQASMQQAAWKRLMATNNLFDINVRYIPNIPGHLTPSMGDVRAHYEALGLEKWSSAEEIEAALGMLGIVS